MTSTGLCTCGAAEETRTKVLDNDVQSVGKSHLAGEYDD